MVNSPKKLLLDFRLNNRWSKVNTIYCGFGLEKIMNFGSEPNIKGKCQTINLSELVYVDTGDDQPVKFKYKELLSQKKKTF